jgi:hypothetical protein
VPQANGRTDNSFYLLTNYHEFQFRRSTILFGDSGLSRIVVGSFQNLTGNHGLIAVPFPLFTNIPFTSMSLALP